MCVSTFVWPTGSRALCASDLPEVSRPGDSGSITARCAGYIGKSHLSFTLDRKDRGARQCLAPCNWEAFAQRPYRVAISDVGRLTIAEFRASGLLTSSSGNWRPLDEIVVATNPSVAHCTLPSGNANAYTPQPRRFYDLHVLWSALA